MIPFDHRCFGLGHDLTGYVIVLLEALRYGVTITLCDPPSFLAESIRSWLYAHKVATLPELKQVLGTEVGMTVFRKLRESSATTPAIRIEANTTRWMKSPALTSKACGPITEFGFPATALY